MSAGVPNGGFDRKVIFLSDRGGSARDQMARDREILSRPSLWRRSLLRLYRIHSGVTVGRSWAGILPPDWSCPNEEIVVRPTGGGAVLHGKDLSLSLFVPWGQGFPRGQDWPHFYERLHGWLSMGLASWGVPSTEATSCLFPSSSSANTPPGGLCFSEPVRGDRMAEGQKILGGALALAREGLLYQGSISLPTPNPRLSELFEGWYGLVGEDALADLLLRGREG